MIVLISGFVIYSKQNLVKFSGKFSPQNYALKKTPSFVQKKKSTTQKLLKCQNEDIIGEKKIIEIVLHKLADFLITYAH